MKRPYCLVHIWKRSLAAVCAGVFCFPQFAFSCTRVTYLGPENTVITARSMDWAEDMKSDLWVFPRGLQREGAAGPNSIKWVSKYGSVITAGYNAGSADGMSETGLVANVLYLSESNYGVPKNDRPNLSIAAWAQYVLDNYATVSQAVAGLAREPFNLIAPTLPNGEASTLHLAISDPSGNSAVFEYVAGKLVIHHGRENQVMTNSPTYEKQLALNNYWKGIGGTVFLPGTHRAADRFVRAAFYAGAIPQTAVTRDALASLFGVIRNASVPLGITTPGQPNISSTRWRTVSDQKNKVYYFESVLSPTIFWVPFADLDFSQGAGVKKLSVGNGELYSGNVAASFVPATPFPFLQGEVLE
ncbi:MAG: linear amide C-N hydrolase [Ottowia sp.]|nr:linear amide C-N hydrolase [Ottowia sp.]